jgi:type III secretion protein R
MIGTVCLVGQADGATVPFSAAGLAVAAAIAVLPILVIAGTSFIKISVVLAILRSALGAPGVPPTLVLTALSAVLTMFVMAPVASDMTDALATTTQTTRDSGDPYGLARLRHVYNAASPPLLDFLKRNATDGEVAFFADLSGDTAKVDHGFRVLLPAFAVGEIGEAFLMGFLVFLPFLVVDLIVAMVLASLGMPMLSPTTVSLPLKLLLFLAVDGWHVILSGLLVNYGA